MTPANPREITPRANLENQVQTSGSSLSIPVNVQIIPENILNIPKYNINDSIEPGPLLSFDFDSIDSCHSVVDDNLLSKVFSLMTSHLYSRHCKLIMLESRREWSGSWPPPLSKSPSVGNSQWLMRSFCSYSLPCRPMTSLCLDIARRTIILLRPIETCLLSSIKPSRRRQ